MTRKMGFMEEHVQRELALIKLIQKSLNRVRIVCTGCGRALRPENIQLRKTPGRISYYYGNKCIDCIAAANETKGKVRKNG